MSISHPELTPETLSRARVLPAATLLEAHDQKGALPSAIKPMAPGMAFQGRAFTVQGPPKDNLMLHRALYAASPGDVLVCHVSNFHEAGYWGEVMSTAAQVRGLAGVVIDGCVRDRDLLDHIGFPVFARGLCIMGTGKDAHARGSLGTPIVIGEVEIHTGDLVVGDADGVVAVRHDHITQTLDKAEERERKEAAMVEALKGGATTLDLMSLR